MSNEPNAYSENQPKRSKDMLISGVFFMMPGIAIILVGWPFDLSSDRDLLTLGCAFVTTTLAFVFLGAYIFRYTVVVNKTSKNNN